MNKLLAVLLASLFATGAFAAAHTGTTAPATSAANPMPTEAMKAGDPKAEAAAQAKVDAKKGMGGGMGDKKAMQPEAMAQGSEKAQARAEMKKAAKKAKRKASTEDQMKKDAAKL